MSPVGGQGLNIALRDVIAAANELVPALRAGAAPAALDAACARGRGSAPARGRAIQRLQALPPRVAAPARVVGRAAAARARAPAPHPLRAAPRARERVALPLRGRGRAAAGLAKRRPHAPLVGARARAGPGLTYWPAMREPVAGGVESASAGAFAALRVRDFRVLWAGSWASYIPFFMANIVQGVVAFELTRRNRAVGTVVFAQGLAMLAPRAARRRRCGPLAEAARARADAARAGGDVRAARAAARARPPHARRARGVVARRRRHDLVPRARAPGVRRRDRAAGPAGQRGDAEPGAAHGLAGARPRDRGRSC